MIIMCDAEDLYDFFVKYKIIYDVQIAMHFPHFRNIYYMHYMYNTYFDFFKGKGSFFKID